ncbi:uncharacterized protein T551_01654 [Pneumocystis jirovecii RU7]|uniref:Uncharacterized protein n=1 Tax=Pneumocystis jirovecii (strain RU7) TaxID=1408657 RepID=A0A0W4ZRY0_PNEJ7|nr:uncharacterized protein T551_01654 [Pneumocystis jirovecii RU7]KTW31102.1 hypothetical protein T551_01654 [Pneumocystis jirovecii RU7]
MFDKYSIQLTNKANELGDFCAGIINSGNNTEARKEFNEKLLKQVQKKYIGLKSKFIKTKEMLIKKQKEYKNIKKKIEKTINTVNYILSTKTPNNVSINKVILIASTTRKTQYKFVLVARTFKLVTKTFVLYIKLKNIPTFNKGCEFKKRCESKVLYKEMEKICTKLEPLKVKLEVVTVVRNTAFTAIKTQEIEKKTTIKEQKSVSMYIMNIWVMHISINTSIFTLTFIVMSTIIFISTKQYKPIKCTTEEKAREDKVLQKKKLDKLANEILKKTITLEKNVLVKLYVKK